MTTTACNTCEKSAEPATKPSSTASRAEELASLRGDVARESRLQLCLGGRQQSLVACLEFFASVVCVCVFISISIRF